MMDAKAPLLPHAELPEMARRPSAKRFSRFHVAAIVVLFGFFWLAMNWDCHHREREDSQTTAKVPLEVHIMSALSFPIRKAN